MIHTMSVTHSHESLIFYFDRNVIAGGILQEHDSQPHLAPDSPSTSFTSLSDSRPDYVPGFLPPTPEKTPLKENTAPQTSSRSVLGSICFINYICQLVSTGVVIG